MKINMANWDRVLRVSIAVGIAALWYTGVLGGVLGIVLLVLAGIFVVSSVVGVCPIYSVIGHGTLRKRSSTN